MDLTHSCSDKIGPLTLPLLLLMHVRCFHLVVTCYSEKLSSEICIAANKRTLQLLKHLFLRCMILEFMSIKFI